MSTILTPKSSERSIQDHLSHYYSQIRSGSEFPLSSLFNLYKLLHPSLHKLIDNPTLDISALNYAIPRLPPSICSVKKVIIAESLDQIKQTGIDLTGWELQGSPARRRQNFYDRVNKNLIILINSDSDIDDFINCLICLQIERQKMVAFSPPRLGLVTTNEDFAAISLDQNSGQKFKKMLGANWQDTFQRFCEQLEINIVCLPQNNQVVDSIVASWWSKISTASLILGFNDTPIYFVSSNLHSLTNLIGGYVNNRQDDIIRHISTNYPDLYSQWLALKSGTNNLRVIDFLYYVSNKYFKDLPAEAVAKQKYEESLGIRKLNINTQLPCDVQLVPVSAISQSRFKDPNLQINNLEKIKNSHAFILNIEYPLGFSAYHILHHILNSLTALRGVYIIGKAAILTGQIGDIQIPKAVFDERTNNIFNLANIFNTYFPFPTFQSAILRDQKAISVYGTFLENENQLQNYIKSGFNIIEMESGPYLSAVHQFINQTESFPHDVVAEIHDPGFDLGIINYASDNPLSQTLGDAVMSIKGVEPTYLAALTTIQRIIDLEST